MKESKPLLAELPLEEGKALCGKLREQLVANVSKTGGHLSSNLGTVELTVALHRVFDTRRDRLVFDVGHQCYVHKMLTGRGEEFSTLRQFGGLSGFPKPSESPHDAFIAGHASNSVAVAVGMAGARELLAEDYHVIALLGDGALTGGLAYEGLGTGGQIKGQLLVILNDNGMSITKNVGGIAKHLAQQRLKPQYLNFRRFYRGVMGKSMVGRRLHRFTHSVKQGVKNSLLPCSVFENMGFTYYGPVDGHDLDSLTQILQYAKEQENPVLLHIRSTKGKDYPPAQESPDAFHGVSPFDPKTGKMHGGAKVKTFSAMFGETMVSLAKEEKALCGITAAMSTGTGLDLFGKEFPKRLFDVGIAEGCAVSMAGGLAKQGAIPVFAVYSTFLQRAYDMIIHDVALQNLHVIFAVDRAGLVGEDGETHHGVFDLAFLSSVPQLTILAPSSLKELSAMLTWAVTGQKGMVAIRYPRGGEGTYSGDYSGEKIDRLETGSDITLVSYGMYINGILDCAQKLKDKGYAPEVLKINEISPLTGEMILDSVRKTGRLLVAEDVVAAGSVGEKISGLLAKNGISATMALVNSGAEFTTHGSLAELQKFLKLDPESLYQRCLEVLCHGEEGKT